VPRSYLGSNPASAQLELAQPLPAALLAAVRQRPGIADADVAAALAARIELAPGTWAPLRLFVVPDLATLRINAVQPDAGAWPPPQGTLLVERSALPLTRRAVGAAIAIELAHAGRRSVTISGTAHDPGVAPAGQEQTVYAYATPATLAALGEPVALDLLKIVVARADADGAAIERTARELAGWLAAQGIGVEEIRVPPPGRHPHQAQMNAVLAMLTIFSALALVLGAVLAATVIGGLLAQQVRQFAIMKAIGARSAQVALPAIALVAALGAAATAIGLPLGVAAAGGFIRAIAQLLNLRLESTAVPAALLAGLALAGIALPLAAALLPILASARRSVRAALDDHGAAGADSALPRLAARLRLGDVALDLALRNSLRRRTRLVLTLALLAGAGAMFETGLALRAAWQDAVARAAAQRHWDIELRLQQAAPFARVDALLRALPVVRAVEPWNGVEAAVAGAGGVDVVHTYPDGGHGGFALRSAPATTTMTSPTPVEGRWLRAEDTDAVVLNTTARRLAFPGAHVGDRLRLSVAHRPLTLRLAGVVDETLTPGAAYVVPATFDRAAGGDGLAQVLRIGLRGATGEDAALVAITAALAREGLGVRAAIGAHRFADAQGGHVAILVLALGFIAALMSVVGLLGLASALAVSAGERTREFGVMRALGASRALALRIVVAEGLVIGAASWVLALAASLPLSAVVGGVLASISTQDLAPRVSPGAAAALLAATLLGAFAASLAPALRASRWTVRQALATV
jgi:putative ABC transport system permease protein